MVLVAAKDEVFVTKCHATRPVHVLTIQIKSSRQLTISANQAGRVFAFIDLIKYLKLI